MVCVLDKQDTCADIKEFTLVKSLLNVNIVGSALAKQETLDNMKEFTLGKSLLNVNIVGSALD